MNVQLHRIYHQIEEELDSFENQLKKLEVPNYPTETCMELIKELKNKVDSYRKVTKCIVGEIDEENPKETELRC